MDWDGVERRRCGGPAVGAVTDRNICLRLEQGHERVTRWPGRPARRPHDHARGQHTSVAEQATVTECSTGPAMTESRQKGPGGHDEQLRTEHLRIPWRTFASACDTNSRKVRRSRDRSTFPTNV